MTALLRCGQFVYIALHLFPTISPKKRHINGSVRKFVVAEDQGSCLCTAVSDVFVQQVARYGDGALRYYFLCRLFNFI